MIEVRQLRKTFEDPDGGEIAAVADVSFTCEAGAVYGLLGPNGAGKTTTLRCLATILSPTSGEAVIAGHDVRREPEQVRRNIGFLAAGAGLYGRLTPRETLRFFGSLNGLRDPLLSARVAEVLHLFEVEPYADRPNDRLSTGMKQRVLLARAVVHDPPVLILDEPTTGLDPIVSRVVEDAVLALAREGKCVLFSTHALSQAEELCSKLGLIAGGRVVAEGTIEELCALSGQTSLRNAFFTLVQGKERADDLNDASPV